MQKITLKIAADTKQAEAALKDVSGSIGSINKASLGGLMNQFNMLKVAAAGVGVAILKEIGGAIYDVGKKSQASWAMTTTLLSGTSDELQKMKKDMTSLASEYGVGAEKMADATYQLLSAGVDQNDVMGQFEKNVKLSTAAGSDLVDTINLTTTVTNAYKMSVEETEVAMEQLMMTQNLGKTTVAELSASMGKAIPIANANSVEFEQLASAYATMTSVGINTAETTTQVSALLRELGDSGSGASKVLKEETGMSFKELMESGADLGDVLSILNDHNIETSSSMQELFSSSEAASAAQILGVDSADKLSSSLGELKSASGKVDEAFDKVTATAEFQEKVMREKFNEALIDVFDSITVLLLPAMEFLAKNMNWIAPVVIALAVAFGMLGVAVGISTIAMLANPITWMVLGVMALIAAVIALAVYWEDIWNFIKTYTKIVIDSVLGFFQSMLQKFIEILDIIKGHWESIWGSIKDFFNGIIIGLIGGFTSMKDSFFSSLTGIKDFFFNIFSNIKDFGINIINGIKDSFSNMGRSAGDSFNGIKNVAFGVFDSIWGKIVWLRDLASGAFNNIVSGVASGLNSAFNSVVGSLRSTFNNFLVSPLNSAIGVINMIPGVSIGGIPFLAKGGVIKGNSNTLAMIGEASHDEAVVPLHRKGISQFLDNHVPKSMLNQNGGGGGVVNNVTINANSANANEIFNIFNRKLARN